MITVLLILAGWIALGLDVAFVIGGASLVGDRPGE